MPQSSKWIHIHISPIYGSWLWQTNMDLPFFEISHIFTRTDSWHQGRLPHVPRHAFGIQAQVPVVVRKNPWPVATHRNSKPSLMTPHQNPKGSSIGRMGKNNTVNTVDCDPWNGEDMWKWVDKYPLISGQYRASPRVEAIEGWYLPMVTPK